MKFNETPLKGAFLIELDKFEDERGFFARAFCMEEFRDHGIIFHVLQMNNSLSAKKGTLRGMHYQKAPKQEMKLVRCIQGSFYDVIIDLREDSKTFGKTFGTVLSSQNKSMLLVPKGFAHGFLTLEDQTEALYLVDEAYSPSHEAAVRWDDPYFNIQWPIQPLVISKKNTYISNFV